MTTICYAVIIMIRRTTVVITLVDQMSLRVKENTFLMLIFLKQNFIPRDVHKYI